MGLCCFHTKTFHSCDESVNGHDKGVTLTIYEREEKSHRVARGDNVRQKKGLTEERVTGRGGRQLTWLQRLSWKFVHSLVY